MPTALTTLFDSSERPIYAVDARRYVVYCNAALATWLGNEAGRIVGRSVEYHSETTLDGGEKVGAAGPLTDLCPPPRALAGERFEGTIGRVGRDGRLVHRRAEFLPLTRAGGSAGGILVLLASSDMSPQELAVNLSSDPTADELHRAIRQFRRTQAAEHAVEALLGESAGIRKVRAQVVAAAGTQATVLIRGRAGTGREHIGRTIHYQAIDAAGKLVPLDCRVANEESLRRTLDAVLERREAKQRNTVLLLNVERLAPSLQSLLLPVLAEGNLPARVVATTAGERRRSDAADDEVEIHPQLLGLLSTMTIDVPSLAERPEDLPLLAQLFLEAANRGSAKQVGALRADALDALALYRWPGELDELRRVIATAHKAATTHEITPADLPAVIHHASKAAALPRRQAEKIVLDEFMASIERELITRAMEQAGGNKSAAAELLGMNRPRLYRRLLQLGLIEERQIPMEELPS